MGKYVFEIGDHVYSTQKMAHTFWGKEYPDADGDPGCCKPGQHDFDGDERHAICRTCGMMRHPKSKSFFGVFDELGHSNMVEGPNPH